MKTLMTVCIWGLFVAQHAFAQLTVNPDWHERNGLTVASSQTISVPAKRLRGFTTLESIDAEPRTAIANLKAKKKSALDVLRMNGIREDSIRLTSTKIREWDSSPKNWNFYRLDSTSLSPRTDLDQYTAVSHMSFDLSLDGIDLDDLAMLPYDICKRLQEQPELESIPIVFLFIGEVDESQATAATKKAYDEANANAKAVAALAGRTLGKLAALTPEMDRSRLYWPALSYGSWNAETAGQNPLANFSPAENEVFGTDASGLSRTYSVELRFEID